MTTINKSILTAVLLFCIAVTLYIQYQSGSFLREFMGLVKPAAEQQASTGDTTPVSKDPAGNRTPAPPAPALQEKQELVLPAPPAGENLTSLDFEDLQNTLAVVDQKQRTALLEDEESFRNFVKKEAANKSVYAAAHANKIDQNGKNLLIARRGAENILREIYLKKLIAAKLLPDFPSEEQVQAYFENNRDKFVLEERVPVWQIFLPVPGDMSQKDIELLKKQAESIINDINKNKTDFATAAFRYSHHPDSKFNGGFMGIVKISDLKPEFKKVLMSLSPDKISSPFSTDDGLHILKRGQLIAKQDLKLEDVQEQIKKLLIKQANIELRQAIFKQAAISYPVAINDKEIEEWRLKLLADFSPAQAVNRTSEHAAADR